MREGILALLALFALISMAVAEDDYQISREDDNLTFSIDQNVSGSGFFSTYRYALMPDAIGPEGRLFNGVEAKNQAHASGTQDMESLFSGESTYVNESTLNPEIDEEDKYVHGEHIMKFDDYEETTTSIIDLKEDNALTYSPMSLSVGLRYYDRHPLAFNSLIKDGVWIKNRDGLSSVDHVVENAHALSKLLNANSDFVNLSLNVEEDLTEGKSHFGALQLEEYPRDEPEEEESEEVALEEEAEEPETPKIAMKIWHTPLVELDEDYIGSFHMKKNMTLAWNEDDEEYDYSWLPCCSGGFLDMNLMERVDRSVSGIFDCTCYNVPTEAQFQRR